MSDLIERQAAIDIERRATVDTNPEHFESHQKFAEFMDNAEISSFGRWQWSNGFNTALIAVGIDLKRLPSAQPEQEDYTEMKQEFLRMASYIDVLLECSDEQKETLMGFISRLAEFMPWTERD